MTNAEHFINFFNKIEKYLTEKEKITETTFYRKIELSKNPVVSRNLEELRKIANLRNVIVHNERNQDRVIAEPNDHILARTQQLFEEISKPLTIIPKFSSTVVGIKRNGMLSQAIAAMYDRSYSQVPVLNEDGTVYEILSNNTIARWLAGNFEHDGSIVTEETTIEDVLKYREFERNYLFLSRTMSVYEAFDFFNEHLKKKKRNLDAMFITDSGKPTEKLLGIITIEDIGTLAELQFNKGL